MPRVPGAAGGEIGAGGSTDGAAVVPVGVVGVGLQSASMDSNGSIASPQSISSSSSSIQSSNLDRAVAKPRRAPTKKKFETKVEDLPPVPVVPIAVETESLSTPVAKQHKGGIWKAIFGSIKSANTSTKSAGVVTSAAGVISTAGSAQGSESGLSTPSLVHPSATSVSAVGFDDTSSAPSPCTPKTPASGGGAISGIFTTLGLKSKKSKKHTTTLSPALTESNLSGMSILQLCMMKFNCLFALASLYRLRVKFFPFLLIFPSENMRHLQGGLDMLERVSESSLSGVHHGLVGTAGKVVVQNMAMAGVQLPIVGAVAVLMLQLIDLCDAYKCNMKLFLALKARMQFLYRLYFAEGGVNVMPILSYYCSVLFFVGGNIKIVNSSVEESIILRK